MTLKDFETLQINRDEQRQIFASVAPDCEPDSLRETEALPDGVGWVCIDGVWTCQWTILNV